MNWRWWHLPLLAVVAVLNLFFRAEMAMFSRLGIDPLANVVLDSGIAWRVVLFLILPIQLIWAMNEVDRISSPEALIRFATMRRWVLHTLLDGLGKSSSLVACLVVPALAAGAGAFTAEMWAGDLGRVVGSGWEVALALVSVGVVIVNLALLSTLAQAVLVAFGRVAGVGLAWAIFAASLMGTVVPMSPLLNPSLGINPSGAVEQLGALGLFLPAGEGLALVGLLAWWMDRREPTVRAAALVAAAVVLGFLASRLLFEDWTSPAEAVIGSFYGGGGSLPDQAFIAVIMLAPAWLAVIHAEDGIEAMAVQLVRTGTVSRWFWLRTRWALASYPVYLAGIAVLSALLIRIRFGSLELDLAPWGVTPAQLVFQALLVGTLQGWCFVVAVLLSRWLVGQSWGGLVGIGVLSGAGLVGGPLMPWNAGLGKLAMGVRPEQFVTVLAATLAILALITACLLTRIGQPILERNLANE